MSFAILTVNSYALIKRNARARVKSKTVLPVIHVNRVYLKIVIVYKKILIRYCLLLDQRLLEKLHQMV